MKTVSFTRMDEGTREDYELLEELEAKFTEGLADRLLEALDNLKSTFGGYQVTRYEHSLQSATRAYRDGANEQQIVAALLHDLGDELAPYNHSEMAAAILRPYVSEDIYWAVKYHGLFQTYYYAHHIGGDRDARDKYCDHPYYQAAVDFTDKWDQVSFDPNYDTMPIEAFKPMVRRVLAEPLNDVMET